MRPSGTTLGVRSAKPPWITPWPSIIPARYIWAITSTMPDPHSPETSRPALASAKPASSDHRSQPMTLNRGSAVAGSMRTRSMAPGAARRPQLNWAPSKAGPVGLEAASRLPPWPSTISALVPTSTTSLLPADRWGPAARMAAAASAPTWPAMHGPA